MQLISSERLESCIRGERDHFEHLLSRCLPDIPFATHHNRFFSEPPMPTHNGLLSEPPTFGGIQYDKIRYEHTNMHSKADK